jgi:CRP/FNR family transcriptional regulator, cyclic AMP receptor protein
MAEKGKTASGLVVVDAVSGLGDARRAPARARLELVRGVPLFADLSRRQSRKVAGLMTEAHYRDRRVIVETGMPGNAFFIIAQGRAKVYRGVVPTGRPLTRLGPGDFFGEIAVLDGGPRSATVVADGDVTVLRLTRSAFVKLLKREATVSIRVIEGLGARLRRGIATE